MKETVRVPSRRQFQDLARLGCRVPVAVRVPLESDSQAVFQALAFAAPSALLESARLHPASGRYSVIVGEPEMLWVARGREIELTRKNRRDRLIGDPLETLERLLAERKAARVAGLPPFVGGAVGTIGYDAVRLYEPIPSRTRDDLGLPDFAFLFCDQAVVLDHLQGHLWAILLADPCGRSGQAYDEALARAETLLQRATRPFVVPPALSGPRPGGSLSNHEQSRLSTGLPADGPVAGSGRTERTGRLTSTHTRDSFEAMVRQAKGFIAEGEIYQANLSQRFDAPLAGTPWEMYRKLTQINPSPFSVFADLGFLQVVSASPERLLRVTGGRAETRPIAGTRPRGRSAVETARLRQELLLNEKERAEHLMLVDLERNDLGRICRYGSVGVDAFMGLEEYSHVIHIVSNVRGALRPDAGIAEAVRALFPGGTITGCPKIRCMEIIEQLEPVRRQLYTGSFGYFSATGDLDLNILIRTAFVWDGRIYFQAGAGIVADSDPTREYEETLHKARAMMETIAPVHPELVEGRTDQVHASTGSA